MPWRIESVWPGRFDDRLVTLPDGCWASATDRALTAWTPAGPGEPAVVETPRPGPLAVLPDGRISWGPTIAGEAGPDPDRLIEAASQARPRDFELCTGTVDPTGTTAVVALRRQPSRVAGAPPQEGWRTRLALVDLLDFSVRVLADDEDLPTALSWSEDGLFVGRPGRLTGHGPLVEWSLTAAPRALAVTADLIAAGLADGTVITWSAGAQPGAGHHQHQGPALALAWEVRGHALASGGADGIVRVGPDQVDLGAPVTALAWPDPARLVAISGNRVLLLQVS